MSFTRKFLEDLGLDKDTVDAVVQEHVKTTGNMQLEIEAAKDAAGQVAALQQEVDTLKGYKDQYEQEKAAHDALRAEVDAASAAKAKNDALRAYFESKGIKGDKIAIAMRAVNPDTVEMDGEKIKDTAALDALVDGDLKPLTAAADGKGSKSGKGTRRVDSGPPLGRNDYGGKPDYTLRSALKEVYS